MRQKRATLTAIAGVVLALAVAACGSSFELDELDVNEFIVGAKSGGTFNVVFGTAPRFARPGDDVHDAGLEADQMVYIPLLAVRPRGRGGRRHGDPRSVQALPTISNGGKTYTTDAAPGPEVLERHAAQGQRLHLGGGADAQDSRGEARPSSRQTSSAPTPTPRARRRRSRASRPTTRRERSRST